MKNHKQLQKFFQDVVKEHQEGRPSDINSKILILDGLNTFIRVFSAVPALNDDGDHVGGVTGFLRSIAANIRLLKPTRVIICFDGKGGSSKRRKLFPEYKANRKVRKRLTRLDSFNNQEDERASMSHQISRLIEYIDHLPLTVLAPENIEAE